MRLCFSSLGCPSDTVDQLLHRMLSLGADGVEIRTLEGSNNLWKLKDFSDENIALTRKKFEDNNISVVCIGTSIRFVDASQDACEEQIETLKRYAKIAQGLGCSYLRVFGGPIPENMSYSEVLQNDIDGYSRALKELEPYGVTLLFETHDDFSLSQRILPLVQALPGTGIIWDILHPYRFGENMKDTWETLKPYIRHVHIKDSVHFSPEKFDIAHVGTGNIPIKTALELLKAANYDGFLSFEWEKHWNPQIDHADVAFPNYVKYMRANL